MKKCKDWQADLSLEDLLICNFFSFLLSDAFVCFEKKMKKNTDHTDLGNGMKMCKDWQADQTVSYT